VRKPVQIGRPREAELEGQTWTDKVFTGDNPNATAKQVKAARARDELYRQDTKKGEDREAKQKDLKKAKEKLNADVEQETQLVSMRMGGLTSEGNIDLGKIRDLRRALRRRYANRTNFQKIFSQWDRRNKGEIDSGDIKHMCQKMGLTINDQESRILLVSADQDCDEALRMNEFIDLIFTTNEALNIDPSRVNKVVPYPQDGQSDHSHQQVLDDIKREAGMGKESRAYNQWKLFIQKNLNNIANDFLESDPSKTYKVDAKDFVKVIERRVQLPEYLKRDATKLNQLIEEYSNQDDKVNYRGFVEDLRLFDYEQATNDRVVGGQKPRSSHSQASSLHSDMIGIPHKRATNIFDDDYVVLDS
jgi:Ca2+-binding EF-hand superfamily protein